MEQFCLDFNFHDCFKNLGGGVGEHRREVSSERKIIEKNIIKERRRIKEVLHVPDHFGGRPRKINAWFLYTHMVYL